MSNRGQNVFVPEHLLRHMHDALRLAGTTATMCSEPGAAGEFKKLQEQFSAYPKVQELFDDWPSIHKLVEQCSDYEISHELTSYGWRKYHIYIEIDGQKFYCRNPWTFDGDELRDSTIELIEQACKEI